jgi:hypothetical protein
MPTPAPKLISPPVTPPKKAQDKAPHFVLTPTISVNKLRLSRPFVPTDSKDSIQNFNQHSPEITEPVHHNEVYNDHETYVWPQSLINQQIYRNPMLWYGRTICNCCPLTDFGSARRPFAPLAVNHLHTSAPARFPQESMVTVFPSDPPSNISSTAHFQVLRQVSSLLNDRQPAHDPQLLMHGQGQLQTGNPNDSRRVRSLLNTVESPMLPSMYNLCPQPQCLLRTTASIDVGSERPLGRIEKWNQL